jgi:hypothetical protein
MSRLRLRNRFRMAFFSALLMLLLGACSPLLFPAQPKSDLDPARLTNTNSIGQTFFSKNDGLVGIKVFVAAVERPGELRLEAYDAPGGKALLAQSTFTLTQADVNRRITFELPAPLSSLNEDFYFVISTEHASCTLGNSSGASYAGGALYADGSPRDRQLNFSLSYDFWGMLAGIGSSLLDWSYWIGIAALVFILPGLVISGLFLPPGMDPGEKLGIAAGTSLAVYPLLLLWAYYMGLQLYAWHVLALALLVILAYFIKAVKTKVSLRAEFKSVFLDWGRQNNWIGLSYWVILLAVVFSRFWAIRSLEAPMWGDSVQHAVMTQLIVDNGGLFKNWLPYALYQSLTVQYGFSTAAAFFSWFSGYSGLYSTLVFGQIANIFAVMSIYPLAAKVAGARPWAGVIAMLAAGLLLPMPAFYVNWGRYAQLAGQVVLPIAIWAMWVCLDELDRIAWKKLIFAAIILSGMSLNYYRMPFFYATFILALALIFGFVAWKTNPVFWKNALLKFSGVILLSVVLIIPWGLQVMNSSLARAVGAGFTANTPLDVVIDDYQIWNSIREYLPLPWLFLAGFAVLAAIVKREWKVLTVAVWVVLLSAYKAGMLVNLPGANMLQSFAVLIALYIPAGILVSWFLSLLLEKIPEFRWKPAWLLVIILGLSLWGANQSRKVVDEAVYAMIKHPDLNAMQWIKENTPQDARFLVEGFRIYAGTTAVGSDGGWYIPLLTRRENTMPPQYALWNEVPIEKGYTRDVIDLVAYLEEHAFSEQQTLDQLCARKITHVYIGQDQGEVGVGENQLFNPDDFSAPFYHLVYAQDRVRIFEIDQGMCVAQ